MADRVSGDSPWWARVASELLLRDDLRGRTLTVEELAQIVPDYPNGRRPRPRTVARRLRQVIRLVGRGPNGSLGRGATYVLAEPPPVGEDVVGADDEWLREVTARLADGSRGKD